MSRIPFARGRGRAGERTGAARSGFTLVEVLLAASILCAGLIGILGAYQACALALAEAGRHLRATAVLQAGLERLRADGLPSAGSGISVEIEPGFQLRMRRVASPLGDDPDLEAVVLAVSSGEGGGVLDELTTVVARRTGSRR